MSGKWIRRLIMWLIIGIILYLVIGAVAPFGHYPEPVLSAGQREKLNVFMDSDTSADRAAIVESNRDALAERLRLMEGAEEEIILSTFDMRPGESTEDLAAMLLHKADEGVKIRILVDGISSVIRMEGEETFYALSSHPNIELKAYNPLNLLFPWKTQGRMHDKYVIADHTAYIMGGRNTFDYFLGDYHTANKSLDREILIYNTEWEQAGAKDSSLFELREYFEGVWELKACKYFHESEKLADKENVKEKREELAERYDGLREAYPEAFDGSLLEEKTVATKGVLLMTGETGIYEKQPLVFQQVCELMKRGKERVLIHTPYVVCNKYMYGELKKVASSVEDVKMMINSVDNGDNFFGSADYLWNKKKVMGTGMEILEYDGGISTHGKSVIIDDNISVVGSFNFDLRSAYMDTEMMVAVKSEELTRQLSANMEELHQDCRKAVDTDTYEGERPEEAKSLPWWKRPAMWAVGLIMQLFRFLV
ncbi:phospholipase D family protein [Lacrimispora sp. NSJ-141]|uniref:Phospholipase D family protein n=1 Tax=Lientehia hominis TaxID=2897778 RepID=A0AAP2RHD2_9FIRM|nr:phospholipase D family protein [Lientehia hominis]MCD2491971.1 phospholipase D family protein [Lientehia hominis]